MSACHILGLKSVFPFTPDAECSCEVNPGMLSDRFAETVAENGINRVSMGAQALQDRLLRTLGRLHTVRDVEKSMTRLREHGIRNINLDLMFGLPGQSVPDWRETLEAAFSLEPEHLSCYGLIPEEGTEMKAAIDSGEVTLPSEEEEREMYDIACRLCEEHGFLHYEISNFALPGRECRHNTDCWERREYIGLGCAACGFKDGIRSRNPGTIAGYLAGEAPEEERISPADARFESMMLGLRMMKGVNEGAFQAQHGISMREAFGDRLNLPVKEGLAVFENGYYRLTRRGMDLQNRVLVALMD